MGEDRNANDGNDYGDPVYPTATGKVVKIQDISTKNSWGKVVVLKHILPNGDVIYSLYAHLSKISVKMDQVVYPNKPLGEIGDANGFYAAHLHFEIRKSLWTPSSPAYYQTLTIANALKFLDPSRFIDDHRVATNLTLRTGMVTFSSDPIGIKSSTPLKLSYVTKGSETLSLAMAIKAGWIGKTVRSRASGTSRWTSTPLESIFLNPHSDYQIEFKQKCSLAIVVPGHNFTKSRARDDMIRVANEAKLVRVRLETLRPFSDPQDVSFEFFYLCFDHGADTSVACLVHAAGRDSPFSRFIVWFDPDAEEPIGDWTAIPPDNF